MTSNRYALVAGMLLAAAWVVGCGGGGGEGASEETAVKPAAGEAGTATAPAEPAGAATTATATAPAASGAVIQTQEVNEAAGMVAELTEATREDGVLTVKIRLRNTGTVRVDKAFETNHGEYRYFYVTAENQKYFILKDAEGAPLAPVYLSLNLEPGQTATWWGKYPAPPAGVAEFDFVMYDVPPFENIPITDR